MGNFFELVGEIAVQGAEASERAIAAVDERAGSLADGLDRAGKRVSDFGDGVSSVGGTLTTTLTPAIIGATAALGAFARSKANAADAIADAATETGLATQSYQEMAFALQQVAPVAEEDVDRAFGRLNQRIGRAQRGNEMYTEALMDLGFTQEQIRSGTLDTEEVFQQFIRRMQQATTDTEAAAVAGELLGTRMGRMIGPALRQAGGEFARFREEARESGGLMSDELIAAGGEFNAMLDRQALKFAGVSNALAENLLPALNELIPVLVDRLVPILDSAVSGLTSMISAFQALPEPLQTMIVAGAALAAALGPVLFVFGKLISVFGGTISIVGRLIGLLPALSGVFSALMGGALIPLIPIILKVAAVAAALWLAWQAGKVIINWLLDNIPGIARAIMSVIPSFDQIRSAFRGLWDGLKSILQSILAGFTRAWERIKQATIGRVMDMVNAVTGAVRKMWQALTGNSIIPRMADEAIAEFDRMGEGGETAGERMRRGLTDAMADVSLGDVRGGRGRDQGGGDVINVDMSHSTIRDDRDMLDRLRRSGADISGAFA